VGCVVAVRVGDCLDGDGVGAGEGRTEVELQAAKNAATVSPIIDNLAFTLMVQVFLVTQV
jgi:hypothetical protein